MDGLLLRPRASSRRRAGSVVGQLPPGERNSNADPSAPQPVGTRRRRAVEARAAPPPAEVGALPWAASLDSGRGKGAVRRRLSEDAEPENSQSQALGPPPMPWETAARRTDATARALRREGRRLSADCPPPWVNAAAESIRSTMMAAKAVPSPWQAALDLDVASRVFGLLGGPDAAAARLVCHAWRDKLTDTREHLSPKTLAPEAPLLPKGWAARFSSLRTLDLSRIGTGSRPAPSSCHGLAAELSALTVLRELRLPLGCRDRDLADCAEAVASRVELLDLSFCEHLTDAGLQAWLREGSNAKVVKLERCPNMTDAAVIALARAAPRLTSLSVSHCGSITDRGAQAVGKLGDLDHLDLSGCSAITDAGLAFVSAGNARLSTLVLYGCSQITDSGVSKLANLKQLSSLNICGCEQVTDHGLAALHHLSSLSSLDASFCPDITGQFLGDLHEHAALTSLNLSYCTFGDPEASLLLPFTKLATLHLRGCDLLSCTGAVEIGKVTSLRDLSLVDCTRVKDRGCSGLAACTGMRALSLSGCARLSDSGLVAGLSQMGCLKWLHLAGCRQLTDESMSALGSLQQLSYLNLTGCSSLTDQGIAALGQLVCLENLILRGCHNVSNNGIAALQSLRGLHKLSLKGCARVTPEGIRSFIQASASGSCHVA